MKTGVITEVFITWNSINDSSKEHIKNSSLFFLHRSGSIIYIGMAENDIEEAIQHVILKNRLTRRGMGVHVGSIYIPSMKKINQELIVNVLYLSIFIHKPLYNQLPDGIFNLDLNLRVQNYNVADLLCSRFRCQNRFLYIDY